MRVGFHSPLPPVRTGVADYSASLIGALQQLGPVDTSGRPADIELYHLGNNPLHSKIYERALKRPGVIVLHDAVLHHFFLGTLSANEYVEEFVYNYGEWYRPMAQALWRRRGVSGPSHEYFQFPMLRRVIENSRAVIVHNPEAAAMVRRHVANARVALIPHLFDGQTSAEAAEKYRFRHELGIAPGTFLFGVFGYLRESKRLPAILEAFRVVHREKPDTGLLVAGEMISQDLKKATAELLRQPGVCRVDFLTERQFSVAASSVDCCINLRSPDAGETSGIAIRLMGYGKPVMVTDNVANSEFPAEACFRIDAGIAERAEVLEHMYVAAHFPEVSRAVGRQAAAFIRTHHALSVVAKEYWNILCAVQSQ